ncbi:hypothetical protein [Pseudokineococcus sp. 1T1Z-3]|uniref:hypothetical protein n=1 Tax=Pseudokineococcus sp. 1T1Z-3 TaxID=3132745 RepID=UPI00309C7C72
MSAEPDASPSGGSPGSGGRPGAAAGDVLPLQPGDPSRLGPFALVGRLGDDGASEAGAARGPRMAPAADPGEAAAVFAASAPDGSPVRVVLLGPGPSGDAAARDRFGAAVHEAGGRGRVLTADLDGPWPWAATAARDARTAAGLARSPLVPAGDDARGPAFSPHWRASARPVAPVGPTTAGGRRSDRRDRRPWVVSAVLALLLLVVLLLLLTGACQPEQQAQPAPAPTSEPQPQPAPEPTPQPTPEPGPGTDDAPGGSEPAPGEEGSSLLLGPGVVGPGFGVDDDVEVLTLEDLPFSFRVPTGWTCERAPLTGVVRYDCLSADETSGGFVQLQDCPAPCGEQAWIALQDLLAPGATWFTVDVTTVAAEDAAPGRDASYRLRMSHLLVAGEREASALEELDAHLYAEFWSPAQDRRDVQRIVNDLRANTP